MADEGTSAHLKAIAHPVKRMSQLSLSAATWSVNQCFERWGLPKKIKIDNGYPFVNPNYRDIPTMAKLWWIGLGIEVIQNPVRCPQENGIVECLQGICKRWTHPSSIQTIELLQKELDWISDFQRNHYEMPQKGYLTRIQLYPELETNSRTYQPNKFNINYVFQFLENQVWRRTVNKKGTLHFFKNEIYIDKKLTGFEVLITFDSIEKQWVVRAKDATLLKTSKQGIPEEKTIKEFALMSKN